MDVREEVRQLVQPLAEEEGLELVDVESTAQGSRRVIRVLLDKPGGVTVGDCARLSRRLSDCLDMNQSVPGSYHLEVSSPGMDRPLRTLEAVRRFAGHRASVTLVMPREGRRHFEGELLASEDDQAGVRTEDGDVHWFAWSDVKSARVVVDPWARGRQGGGAR